MIEDDEDYRDELRLEDQHRRRMAEQRARHPNSQDPDYVPDEDEDE